MDQVLDRIAVWGWTGASILFGAVLVIVAVEGYIKKAFRSAETLVRLFAGAALIAIGLVYSLDIVRKDLVSLAWMMVLGMLYVMEGTGILSISLTGGLRKSLSVLLGAVFMLFAASIALDILR